MRRKKRVGRGIAAGKGKTAGRGTKGQKARSGTGIPRRFAGGETALIARLPKKRGMKSHRIKPQVINLEAIDQKFKEGEKVNPKTLFEKGLIKDPRQSVKVLGRGELKKKLNFQSLSFSREVKAKILKNHGK